MSALGQKRTYALQKACPLWVKSGHMHCKRHVRFTPNSDRESGLPHKVIPRPTSFSGVFEMGPSRRTGFLNGRRDPLRLPLALFEIDFQPEQE